MNSGEEYLTDAQMLRLKAEEQLIQKNNTGSGPEPESEANRLLHELQVHQIELEMQNEELRQANETTEAALKKYTMLYDFAPMGYFTLDADCTICDLNFTGAEILGDKRFALINSNFRLFVSEASKPAFDTFFHEIFYGINRQSCEVVIGYDNLRSSHAYLEGIQMPDERKCLLSVVDISGLTGR